jgi:hypothetical protein
MLLELFNSDFTLEKLIENTIPGECEETTYFEIVFKKRDM